MALVKGKLLTEAQRIKVLAAFIYRWTTGNHRRKVVWSKIKGKPTIPLISDKQWLEEYAFYFNKDGELSSRHDHCVPVYMVEG